MPLNIDIGDKFGWWTVIGGPTSGFSHYRKWLCRCQCSKNPAWLQLGIVKDLYKRLCAIAINAIGRCTVPSYDKYLYYGKRGIKVHLPWVENYRLFIKYLLTLPGYNTKGLWLDRIDNDGNYEPGNLRFATPKESNMNRKRKSEM